MPFGVWERMLRRCRFLIRVLGLVWLALLVLGPTVSPSQAELPTVVDFYRTGDALRLDVVVQHSGERQAEQFPGSADSIANFADGMVMFGDRIADMSVEVAPLRQAAPSGATRFSLLAQIPDRAATVTFHWPQAFGAVLLRQREVAEPFAGYFAQGQHTDAILLSGGAARGVEAVAFDNLSVGLASLQGANIGLLLLAVAIFLNRGRPGPMLVQLLAVVAGFACGTVALSFHSWSPPGALLVWVLPVATIGFALDNILMRALHLWRLAALFALAALHITAFAAGLEGAGLSKAQVVPSAAGYGVGIALGMCATVALGYGLIGFWHGQNLSYRGRVIMPASFTLIGVVLYQLLA